jgi:hypothetical protein
MTNIYQPIELLNEKKLAEENEDLFIKLKMMSLSDLKILKNINSKKDKYIKNEIEYKIFSNSLDEIDKIEIEKFRKKLKVQLVLIDEAIEQKFLDLLI